MDAIENVLKQIPQVEKLLESGEISGFIPELGRSIIINIIREEIRSFRERFEKNQDIDLNNLMASIVQHCAIKKKQKLQRVINGSGVIIHTNLGRAPLSAELLLRLPANLSGYCNLELDLASGARGKRGGLAEELLSSLTGAEDTLIVNNNAAAVFLILSEFARGKEVLVSRGELVQIGDGFRIPEILNETEAKLVETGTTNITELSDFRNAITENTAMILSIHQSNFKIQGFSSTPSLKELSSLKSQSVLFVRDAGSGNLMFDARFPKSFEPTISRELAEGVDLVSFSGDKMLGSCQAGVIAGRKDLIKRLRKNPLMRILRPDKISYFILQESLIEYSNREIDKIFLWNIIYQNKKILGNKTNRLMKKIKAENKKDFISRIQLKSSFGGGALPTLKIESTGIQIGIPGMTEQQIYDKFLAGDVPIVGYIFNEKFTLDLRTISDNEIPEVALAIDRLISVKV